MLGPCKFHDHGLEFFLGKLSFHRIDPGRADDEVSILAGDSMVEGDVPGAGKIVFLEEHAGVMASESFRFWVPGGLHGTDMCQDVKACVEVFKTAGTVFAPWGNGAAADVAETGLGGGSGTGMVGGGHCGMYWRGE